MAGILRQRRIGQIAIIALVAVLAFAGAMVFQPATLSAFKAGNDVVSEAVPPPQPDAPPAVPKTATPAPAPAPSTPSKPATTPAAVVAAPAAAPTPAPTPAAAAPPPPAPAVAAAAPTPAPAPPVVAPPPAKPAPLRELSGADELERRIAALADVRKVAGVVGSDWSTKSTLVVSLNASTDDARKPVVDAVCAAVVAYEELRFTRLQINDASATRESEKRVHWHQCK